MIAGAGLNDRRDGRVRRRECARRDRAAGGAGRAVQYRRGGRRCISRARAGTAIAASSMSTTRPAGRCSRRWRRPPRRTPTSPWCPTWRRSISSPGRHGERYSGEGHVWGVYALDRASGRVELFTGRATILATGGAGRAYLYSHRAARRDRRRHRDGVARGRRVSNMEFMQFHPTCLYNLEVKNFLITEAVRGEGGQLKLPAPATASCPISTTAPNWRRATSWRARSITRSSGSGSITSISTSATCRPSSSSEHFPNIYAKLLGARHRHHEAADPGRAGAALYLRRRADRSRRAHRPARPLCGRRGAPSRACTAPTGSPPTRCSNASCSARRRRGISPRIATSCPSRRRSARGTRAASPIRTRRSSSSITGARSAASCGIIVGIVRTTKRLERAQHRIALLRQETDDYYGNFRVTPDLIELRNLVEVADLIVRSALVSARRAAACTTRSIIPRRWTRRRTPSSTP